MCNCIEAMNERLAEFKAAIACTLFSNPQRTLVQTCSTVESRRGIKRAPTVLASFCPFCGEKYEPEPAKASPNTPGHSNGGESS